MEKIFVVEYNEYDEVENMECNMMNATAVENLQRQIDFTKKLKRQGYTHVADYLHEINTGEKLCDIDNYILELTADL